MGFWDTLKPHAASQFLEVIEWLDDSNDTIVYRYPVFNQKITDNSKLVVREGQAAVFVSEGKLSDVFGPGTYTLDTRNTPILSFFQSIAYKLNYPYKGDIYYVNTKVFRENRWGTSKPFPLRDAEFGPIRVRAFGIYSYRITDPASFLRQVVGTDGLFTTDEINGQLKRKLVSALSSSIAKARIPILDLAASYMEMGDQLKTDMNPSFQEAYGISLTDFTIESISLPDEVEAALDTRSKMGVLGDLNAYTQLKAADAIQTAAANPGLAGAGMGMGVGIGMGNVMGGMMGQAMAQPGGFNPHQGMQGPPAPQPPPPPMEQRYHYNGPGGTGEFTASEIAQRVVAQRSANHQVWAAGFPGWKSWQEVAEIAGKVPPEPVAPPPVVSVSFHYAGPTGQGEKTLSEVVALVRAQPDANHQLWRAGFASWTLWRDVPEVASAVAALAGPPPMPGGPPPL
ncbi:MAG: SPFH domain-containing protein [Deltaproteobacteria bacterium]|nr:SPFH domain-containing protein [Deltaproteobacteria bacterium]